MLGSVHILAVRAFGTPVPFATVHDGQVVRRLPLEGPFAWEVSPGRRCVGRWTLDGHRACPVSAPVGGDLQCPRCNPLEDPACVFEPRCRDRPEACTCTTSFAGVPHVVYLAFYATLPKVGLTAARRFETRLQEQGADAGFVVAGADSDLGRGPARLIEQEIALLHRVPEHRSGREVLAQTVRDVPTEAVAQRIDRWRRRLARYTPGPARWFDAYPWSPLPARPFLARPDGLHRGVWLGGKGRHVYYRVRRGVHLGGPPVAAVKVTDLVGRVATLQEEAA